MRITQAHLFNQAFADIQRSLLRYTTLQQQVASGRRVSEPSDDPAASLRIIPLQNDLRGLAQFADHAAMARETFDTGAAALEDGSALMQRVRELAIQASNGSMPNADRAGLGAELDQLLQQLVGIGNSRRGETFLFGGTESGRPPFELVNDAGGTRVRYRGNHDRLEVEVAPGIRTALNVAGDSIFQQRERSGVTFDGDTGARPTGSGDTAIGLQTLQVRAGKLHTDAPAELVSGSGESTAIGQLAYVFTVTPPTLSIGGGPALPIPAADQDFTTADGRVLNLTVTGIPAALTGTFTSKATLSTDGGATTVEVSDFSDTCVAVPDSFDGSVLNVDVRALVRTGDERVEHGGTFDAFTVIIALRDLMKNEAGLPDEAVRARVADLLQEIEGAHEDVLDGVRELGFRSANMQVLRNRVEALEASRAESLSVIQDTDMAAVILELQRQDVTYQAALQVGARVIQTTLGSFL